MPFPYDLPMKLGEGSVQVLPGNMDSWQDADGAIFQPQDPQHPEWQKNTNWNWASDMLTAEATKMVWIGPNLRWWNLAGNLRGREGVIALNEITGIGPPTFEHKYLEGPYVAGATLERVDIKKRIIGFGVILNPNTNRMDKRRYNTSFKYRALEKIWWESFSKSEFGYLGFFTRSTGWRFIKCILEPATTGKFSMDPVAFKNNGAQYDMSVVAVDPYFYKMPLFKTWKNNPASMRAGWGTGRLQVANRGTVSAAPMYIVTAPGMAYITDGPDGSRAIAMPQTVTSDLYYMVDTKDNMRTITSVTDPVDNPFYRFVRQSGIASFLDANFFGNLAATGLPLWRRWGSSDMFSYEIAPGTNPVIGMSHNYPWAEITLLVPQRYESAWG